MKLIAILSIFAGTASVAVASSVTVDQYLDQVRAQDPSYQAATKQKEGVDLTKDSADLLTGINLFSTYSNLIDSRPTATVAAQGDKTTNESLSVGLKQQTLWGPQWSLSHNYSHTEISNATAIAMPNYYDLYPKLELSVPLWRNSFGREIKSTRQQLESQIKLQQYNAEMMSIQKESEIKEAFYNLATQQKNFQIQKDSLERAEKILSWSKQRVDRNLSDRSDLYQTQALVSARKIELINAEQKLKEAARLYNSFLGTNSEEVSNTLVLNEIDVKQLQLRQSEQKVRLDLLIQKQNLIAQESSYLAQIEKNKPNLDLSLAYAKYGRDSSASEAQSNITSKDKDYLVVAVNFSMPLDIGNSANTRQGYQKLAESQVLAERSRLRSEGLEWAKAIDQAEVLGKQLQIVRDLERVQKEKADLERSKYNNGRSTTYQVLSFEQDYINARNQTINLELQLRKFINSLSLYTK